MLKSIHIRNFVLIESLDLEIGPGFSVITGQTGAGKTIILEAIGLLSGARADAKAVAGKAAKCTVEACFSTVGMDLEELFNGFDLDYDPEETLIRREVSQTGKSRAFVNDTPVTLTQLREITARLIDIHSQHQNLMLGTEGFQLAVTDTMAGNAALRKEYHENYIQYCRLEAELARLKESSANASKDQDWLQFQLDGLKKAALKEGEQEELEAQQDLLSHAEEIKGSLYQASETLDGEQGGILNDLRQALQALRTAARNCQPAQELAARVESCSIELKDIAQEVSRTEDSITFDPTLLEQVTERLDLIYSLEKKHQKESITGLLSLQKELEEKLDRTMYYDEAMEVIRKAMLQKKEVMTAKAEQLTASRLKAAKNIEKEISRTLVPLGIPKVRFSIDIQPRTTPDATGADSVRFLFSANPGMPMEEIAAVASGGETSRVMLAVKSLLSGATLMPTVVFDEIDTGVSGAVAEKMALLMRNMCHDGRQVIAITHLPQIAAKGDRQFCVYKTESADGSHTEMRLLNHEERVTEIAQMMSGESVSKAALDNARTLLEN